MFGFSRNFRIFGGNPGPIYYLYLYNEGVTSSKLFSLYIGPLYEDSFVEFDSYDISKYGKSDQVLALKMDENFFWQA